MIYENEDFKYDSETGLLYHNRDKSSGRDGRILKAKKGDLCGQYRDDGYLRVRYKGKQPKQHRVIWWVVTGKWPENEIDHINGITDDNRLCNLREVDDFGQPKNHKKYKSNTSGITGVYWHKRDKKWFAQISNNKKLIFLGYFNDWHDAYHKRKIAEVDYGYSEFWRR